MSTANEDFFDAFRTETASKVKKFNFKDVVGKREEKSSSVNCTRFEVNTASCKAGDLKTQFGNARISPTFNDFTESKRSKVVKTDNNVLKSSTGSEGVNNCSKQSSLKLNKAGNTTKPVLKQSVLSLGGSKQTLSLKKSEHSQEKTSSSDLNIKEAKKFTFKKTETTNAVDRNLEPSISDKKVKRFSFKNSHISNKQDTPKKSLPKKTLSEDDFTSPSGSRYTDQGHVFELKNIVTNDTSATRTDLNTLESNFNLDDYMDDETFANFLACDMDSDETNTNNQKTVLEESKAEPELDASVNLGFAGRKDDSSEFRRTYPHSEVMCEVLHQKFGLRGFRPHQQEIINASLTQHDCFVLMPTGGGKSLCYQLPAILMPGVTIVISPLRALISDQVDKLNSLDISSCHLCSDVKKADADSIFEKLSMREPPIKLLYLTPEKISASGKVNDVIKSLYQRGKLARFVIDEVHCLSQWGHDFRPDYKQLSLLRKNFRDVPIICLTATATKQVQGDVTKILALKNVKTFIRSFNRPNIKYKVISKTGKKIVDEIASLVKQKFYRKSGIIYCLCRADCEKLADDLNSCGIKARAYHAGLGNNIREQQQREWMQDQFHVIVATIAFGMGIDKPDVRFVIHNSIPKSVEAFYQESGRAGRDGEPSFSYLYYSYGDVGRLKRLMQMDRNVNRNTLDGHFENLHQMVSFCENSVDCRRYLQLLHLGEKFDRKLCMQNRDTTCDNCENISKFQTTDVTKEAKELALMVKDLTSNENVTMLHVVEVYKGSRLKKIIDKRHDQHRFHGSGKHLDRTDIQRILVDLIVKKVLADSCTYTGEFPVVYMKVGPKFTSFGNGDLKISIATGSRTIAAAPVAKTNKEVKENDSPGPSTSSNNKALTISKHKINLLKVECHEELIEQCRTLAVERNTTLSTVMNLSALKNMSDVLPNTEEEFMKIQHVTKANYEKFGEYFLKITQKYRQKLDAMQPVASFNDSNAFEDSDWSVSPQASTSTKRKSLGGYKKNVKRFKRNFYNKKGKGKRKSAGKKNSPKKNSPKNNKKKGVTKSLGLMPLR